MTALHLVRRAVFGTPIASSEAHHTLLSKRVALPVFASDAISSVAYATQQILLAFGAAGLWMIAEQEAYSRNTLIVTAMIVGLLFIIVMSYWQTIYAYPSGGGSYIVSKDNLGTRAGLIAAAALLIDYVLTVSVSVASGVQNLASIPALRPLHLSDHFVFASIVAIAFLTIANLRGLKESGRLFAGFTYGFVILALITVTLAIFGANFGWHFELAEVHEVYRSHPPSLVPGAASVVGIAVFLRAFANGCCAMTGTEAVSNGIPAFQHHQSRNAAITLVWMAIILAVLFFGTSLAAIQLHIVYWEEGGRSAPAVIDQISGAVYGKSGPWSVLYLAMQFFTAAILILAANTSFADFPRLASILARDGFVPRQFSSLGDRLVFHNGIFALGVAASLLIVAKGGSVDALIPMYAVGVFTAFTLSQAGMVRHWLSHRGRRWQARALLNGLGAIVTAVVLADIAVEKFAEGAWVVILVIALSYAAFRAIARHYVSIRSQLALDGPPAIPPAKNHLAVVLVSGLHRATLPALAYAASISENVEAVSVELGDPSQSAMLMESWNALGTSIPLTIVKSPHRSLVRPIIKYLNKRRSEAGADGILITAVIPELVPQSWWHRMLHGNSGLFLRLALGPYPDVVVAPVRFAVR